MARILSIETSTDVCSVAIHQDGVEVSHQTHRIEKSHSSLLPSIVLEICEEANLTLKDLDAVAVSEGPGSYTGLRIGVSTAKGFAYTLQIPVIAIPTLDIMIQAVAGKFQGPHYLCAMMDARRMEVYTKLVDEQGAVEWEVQPKILAPDTLSGYKKPVYVFGNGAQKFHELTHQENLMFIDDIYPAAMNMGSLAWEKYQVKVFEDVAYFEPNYLKAWRTTTPKKQLNKHE